ncbi:MAG TPA: hypothetical protein VGW38_07360 [Chloroflexota bacterium]|nr:hypothetical protein [Chloroflexota bacterium]
MGSYAAAKQRIPERDGVEYRQVRSSMRCNNRVEQAHQPTRIRERRMGRFRWARTTYARTQPRGCPKLESGAIGAVRLPADGRTGQCSRQ